MLLEGKNAVVYGGGGSIGGAVARAFAREGATVFLTGRTQPRLDVVATDIRAAGGTAETAVFDALDERAVDAHADAVAAQAGSLDVSINVIQHGDVQGTPMVEMAVDDFLAPVVNGVRTTFITWRAAARHMIRQGGGAIIAFGGDGDPLRGHHLGGLQIGFTAIETMRRQLSMEAGSHGVRVVTLRTGGIPESLPAGPFRDEIVERSLKPLTMLDRLATLEDVGDAAAFAASDRARSMTAATINISCGALID